MKIAILALVTMLLLPLSVFGYECYADTVVEYHEGTNSNGGPIDPDRTHPENALGVPEGTDVINFVSLGFGGYLILGFDSPLVNVAGNDFSVIETSYGNPSCSSYPEKVDVYASNDGQTWTYLGEGCLDSEFDLGPLEEASYLKLVDVTDPNQFGGTVDAFDVDGIIGTCGEPEVPEFTAVGLVLAFLGAGLIIYRRK